MTEQEAIARARAEVAVLTDGAPIARRVGHGGPAGPYWLVTLEGANRTLAVVAIGDDGSIVGAGRPARATRHVAVDAGRARELAGAAPGATAELVWWPSTASRSPLFPLWQVRVGDRDSWVALDGTVLRERPGGAARAG